MSVPLTYFQFLSVFVVPLLVVVAITTPRPLAGRGRIAGVGITILALVALGYTVPWDNYLVGQDVWWYGEQTVRFRIWNAPVEEYLFILLQSLLTGLWVSRFANPEDDEYDVRAHVPGAGAWILVALAGALSLQYPRGYYLGAILLWAAPVLAVQWAYGGGYLWATKRRWTLGVLAPTLYLCISDRIAIELGIWHISPSLTTGVAVGGLPIEEGAFFLLTNLLLVQGFVLFLRVTDRWR
ncbi:lycopene cyclase domain-containing protein [Haladaptatus sp. NG-WS-4]